MDTETRFNPTVQYTVDEYSPYELFIHSRKGKYKDTSIPPTDPTLFQAMYLALGMNGEAGEYAEEIKKWHRDGNFDRFKAALELGDTLYYLIRSANNLGFSLQDILDMNEAKLTTRV